LSEGDIFWFTILLWQKFLKDNMAILSYHLKTSGVFVPIS